MSILVNLLIKIHINKKFFNHLTRRYQQFFLYIFKKKGIKVLNNKFLNILNIFLPVENKLNYSSEIQMYYRVLKKKNLQIKFRNDYEIETLINRGFLKIGKLKNIDYNSINQFLKKKEVVLSHIPLSSANNKRVSYDDFINNELNNYGSFLPDTYLKNEEIKKILFDDKIHKLAKKYLMTDQICLYSTNLMISKKSKVIHDVSRYHRDKDHLNCIAFFILLKNTKPEQGATKIIEGSHLLTNMTNYEDKCSYLSGNTGDIYAIDPWILHAGCQKILNERIVLWLRYSKKDFFYPGTYYLDKNFLSKEQKKINKKLNEKF